MAIERRQAHDGHKPKGASDELQRHGRPEPPVLEDCDHPEPTATLTLDAEDARRLLQLLDGYDLKYYAGLDASLASRLMTAIENMESTS